MVSPKSVFISPGLGTCQMLSTATTYGLATKYSISPQQINPESLSAQQASFFRKCGVVIFMLHINDFNV